VRAALERARERAPEVEDEAVSERTDDAPVERAGRRFTA